MVSALHLVIPLVPMADLFVLLPRLYVGACGKTSLLCSFALGEFPKEYVSRMFMSRVNHVPPLPLLLRANADPSLVTRLLPAI